MSVVKLFRETALPSTLEANSIYFIAPTATPEFIEIYVVGNTSSVVKRTVTKSDVLQWINEALSSAAQEVYIVNNIAARNALNPTRPTFAYVIDATGDSTVSSGGATYLYNPNTESWIKIAEWESMDLVIQWSSIQGRPTSSPADIDDAVSKRHTHTNMTQLNKIGEDSNGFLTYGGQYPRIAWNTTAW